MDLIYLPDSLCYPFHLSSINRTNRGWEDVNEISAKNHKKEKTECSKDSKNCSICKSRQKRALSTYIMKTRRDSEKDAFAEEEEEEEEEEKGKNHCSSGAKRGSTDSQRGEKPTAQPQNKCSS